jgi:general secretion pathway protein K
MIPRARPKTRREKRGVALVLVLGALAIMTVMLTEFQDEATGELSAALADRDALKAEYLAKSGINLARLLLSSEKTIVRPALALLSFGKSAPPQIPVWEFSDKILGAFNDKEATVDFAALTNTDLSTGKNLGIDGGRFAIDIIDEDSKLNINVAARGDLITENRLALQLLALMGGDQYSPMFEQRDRDDNFSDRAAICGAIIDWADPDESMNQCDPRSATPVTQAAEDISYQVLKKPYFRKNAAYDSLDELHLVRGISDDFWATFVDPEPEKPKKRVMTVWGQGAMNVNTANAQDLLLLACAYATPQTKLCNDLTEMTNFVQVVTMIKGFLSGIPLFGSGQEFIKAMSGTGSGMIATFLKSMKIEPVVFTSATEAAKAATAESSVFSIYADGIVPGYQRKTRVRIHAVVDFRGAPAPGASPVNQMNVGSDAGAAAAPPPGQFGGGAAGTSTVGALTTALAPNPGGTIIYYRME